MITNTELAIQSDYRELKLSITNRADDYYKYFFKSPI